VRCTNFPDYAMHFRDVLRQQLAFESQSSGQNLGLKIGTWHGCAHGVRIAAKWDRRAVNEAIVRASSHLEDPFQRTCLLWIWCHRKGDRSRAALARSDHPCPLDHFARSRVSHRLDGGDAIRRKEQDQIAPSTSGRRAVQEVSTSGIRPLDHAVSGRKNRGRDWRIVLQAVGDVRRGTRQGAGRRSCLRLAASEINLDSMTHDEDLVSASRVAIEASRRMLDALRRGLAESRRQVEATHAQIAASRAVIGSTPCALLHRKRLPP
jgi:hypothetical protein